MIKKRKANNMTNLTPEFIKKQKMRLLEEKKRLEKELKIDNSFPEYGDSEEDNSSEVTEFTERKGIEKQFKKELQSVNLALKNIELGKYGICRICNNEIEEGRLEIVPSSTTCSEHSSQ